MGSSTYNAWFATILNTVAAQSTATINQATGGTFATTDPIWAAQLPAIIEYSENRIYREGDFYSQRITDASATCVAMQQTFTLPTSIGAFIVPEYIGLITPSSANVNTGTLNELTPVSRAYLAYSFPNIGSNNGTPQVFAVRDAVSILLGPSPDLSYPMVVTGTQRPNPLSATNQTTFLTTYCPDLFFAATMIAATAFMRDYGSQSDNPQAAVSWEQTYQTLAMSVMGEEARRQYRSAGWTQQTDLKQSKPPRQ